MSSRRNTELFLLIASAFPVLLLYAMYVLTLGGELTFQTLAVPLGLFAAFAAAHIAVRIFAPGADPAILPIVFALSGIGITFVTRLKPELAMSQLIILFVSVALMVITPALVKNLDVFVVINIRSACSEFSCLCCPCLSAPQFPAPSFGFASAASPFSPVSSQRSLSFSSSQGIYLKIASCSQFPAITSLDSSFLAYACSCPFLSFGACAFSSLSSNAIWAARFCSTPSSSLCFTSPRDAFPTW